MSCGAIYMYASCRATKKIRYVQGNSLADLCIIRRHITSCGVILKLNLHMYACYWATTYTRYIFNNILSDLYVIWHRFIWFVHCDIHMLDMSCSIHSLVYIF